MGTFSVEIEVANLSGESYTVVQALVDTGASHTAMPASFLRGLGVEPDERWPFRLADDSVRQYEVGQARVRIDSRERFTLVVFAAEGSRPLLGATTLEQFNLGVAPAGRRLIPLPGLLL